MEADYETPDGLYLCAEHADKHVQLCKWGASVAEYNKAAGCDLDGYPLDGSDTPDEVYRWMDGETCEHCK